MSELLPCPFCGKPPVVRGNLMQCDEHTYPLTPETWNRRAAPEHAAPQDASIRKGEDGTVDADSRKVEPATSPRATPTGAAPPSVSPKLVERLQSESDLCANEGATDISKLLDEAIAEIIKLRRQYDQLLMRVIKEAAASVSPQAQTGEEVIEIDEYGKVHPAKCRHCGKDLPLPFRGPTAEGADWVVSAEALRIANETLDEPDARAQVKVKLVAAGLPLMADLVDEAAILSREIVRLSAAPRPDAQQNWKVFCAICKCEWSVPYQHPGKSICENCEQVAVALYEGKPPRPDAGERRFNHAEPGERHLMECGDIVPALENLLVVQAAYARRDDTSRAQRDVARKAFDAELRSYINWAVKRSMPKEPTPAMLAAAVGWREADPSGELTGELDMFNRIYRAMYRALEAARALGREEEKE